MKHDRLSNIHEIAIVGLGYVGLPLACELAKHFKVTGYDIDATRINELRRFHDQTHEVEPEILHEVSKNLSFSTDLKETQNSDVFIITVPTPISADTTPNLEPLISASKSVGSVIRPGAIIIYESTVYPGATEEVCIPLLEECSGLKVNEDFGVGYSPERINPGDKNRTIRDIVKITSGSNASTSDTVDEIYRQIITKGTYQVSSIRVAEAAKVIENTQRDLNIALANELAKIFELCNVDTHEVLDAAATKWNFLRFEPGLVGGHCISVDPYYLTYKSMQLGYQPEVILAGRKTNETMAQYIATRILKSLVKYDLHTKGNSVLLLGCTFKENCPDMRNTKVFSLCNELKELGISTHIYDPWVQANQRPDAFKRNFVDRIDTQPYSSVVLCVKHSEFSTLTRNDFYSDAKDYTVLFDLKGFWDKKMVDERL